MIIKTVVHNYYIYQTDAVGGTVVYENIAALSLRLQAELQLATLPAVMNM